MKYYINLEDFKSLEDRKALARCSSNENLLIALAKLDDFNIAEILLSNPKITNKVLKKLSESDNWRIKCLVAKDSRIELNILEKLSFDDDENVKVAVASNEKISEEIALHLSNDPCSEVKQALAGNKKISKKIFFNLASTEENDDVLLALINNPCIERDILELIIYDKTLSDIVRLAAYDQREEILLHNK